MNRSFQCTVNSPILQMNLSFQRTVKLYSVENIVKKETVAKSLLHFKMDCTSNSKFSVQKTCLISKKCCKIPEEFTLDILSGIFSWKIEKI